MFRNLFVFFLQAKNKKNKIKINKGDQFEYDVGSYNWLTGFDVQVSLFNGVTVAIVAQAEVEAGIVFT